MPTPATRPRLSSTKPTAKQPVVEPSEVGDGRQLEKEGAQAVGLELAFLPQVHAPGQPGQGERPEGQHRERRVELQPRVDGRARGAFPAVEAGKHGKGLQAEDQRGREHSQGRQAVGVADDEVKEHERPAEENDDLEEVRQRATPPEMAARDEELGLQQKPDDDEDEVDARRKNAPPAERQRRVKKARQEHERRKAHAGGGRAVHANEQGKVHQGSPQGDPHLRRRAGRIAILR